MLFPYEQKNITDTKIPMVMWIALAWFASDNIAGYLMSPIIFYPVILALGIAAILHSLGILGLLINMGLPAAKARAN